MITATADPEVASRRSAPTPKWLLLGVAALVVVVLPSLMSSYWTVVATNVILTFAIAAPLNMLTGNAGQFSLGNAAFVAVGAYTASLVALKLDYQMPVALIVAAVVGTLVGLIVGYPSLRLRGAYLLMSTLAAHYLIIFAAQKFQTSQFGAAGAIFPPLQVGGVDLSSDRSMYFVIAGFASLCGLIIYNLMRSGYGRALEAVKARDVAAAACGISVARMKLSVWCLTSGLIAAAGVLQAYFIGAAAYEYYTLDLAITYVAVIIVGGLGSLGGSFLGACFVTLVPVAVNRLSERYGGDVGGQGLWSHPLEIQIIVYGAIIITFVIFKPEGLIGLVRSTRDLARRTVRGAARG